jgi:DNA-binding transcriptional LysR family regulator
MHAFVCAVEKGSFTAAADAMQISPTMVAKHIRFLEERVGEPLLNRSTRRQSLTEVGTLYYERCRRLIADADSADACASELRNAPRGLLKVHAPVSFGTQRLVPALTAYMRQYQAVNVDLTLSDRPAELMEQGHEVAIRIGALGDARLVAKPLRPYEMWLCASPAYLEVNGTPQVPVDLRGHNCLGFAYWRRKDVWRLRTGDHVEDVPVSGRLVVNNGQALRMAALAGLGVIAQPEALLSDDVAAGRLVRLLSERQLPARPMHIVYPRERRQSPKVRSFVDFVVETFG